MTRARPDKPEFIDGLGERVRTRQAQLARLRLKSERTYRSWLTCRSPELKEVLEAKVLEYEDRIANLERLLRATQD
jgi:hypothetical protein